MTGTISKLSALLKNRQISSAELTNKYISAIVRENSKLNAFVCTTFEQAIEQAKRADEIISRGEGTSLTGIPFALKDNIVTDGIYTTCCSQILKGYKPYYDAAVWEKLKTQGAVLLGKTNMDEFAMGTTSETSVYGAPLNPRNLNKVTGGSSGGSAAAVCASLAAYSLGSDTGGSIRQPASFCGVVGFKPTYGAVSRYGLIAYASSLDQIGPITQTVSDAAIVFDAIRGKDNRDFTSMDIGGSARLNGEVKGLKIGVPEELFEGVDGEVIAAVKGAISHYEKAGAQVENISLPALKSALPAYYVIACAEASSNLGRYDGIRYGYRAENYDGVDDMIIKTRTQGFGKEVKKRIMLGTFVLSSGYREAYYKKACMLRKSIESELEKTFEKYDILIAPTAPTTAFDLGYSGGNAIKTYLSDKCTVAANIAGLPAISLPCGTGKNCMPIGLQIIGKKGEDFRVLDAAYFSELDCVCNLPEVEGGVKL